MPARGKKKRDRNCSKAEIVKCRKLTGKTKHIENTTLAEKAKNSKGF